MNIGMDCSLPARVLKFLLLRAGIEQNPGPFACSVCYNSISENFISFECQTCKNWCHHRCSGLSTYQEWSRSFIGPCCKGQSSSISALQQCNGLEDNENAVTANRIKLKRYKIRGKFSEILPKTFPCDKNSRFYQFNLLLRVSGLCFKLQTVDIYNLDI